MTLRYETERLAVRDLADGDADALHALHREPRLTEWLAMEPSTGPEQELALLAELRTRGWPEGTGFLGIVERGSERLVGILVLKPFATMPYWDLGWRLHPDVWGRGYATEAARGAIEYATTTLGLTRRDICAITQPHNARSRAVMERLGMTYDTDIEYAGLPHVRYLFPDAP